MRQNALYSFLRQSALNELFSYFSHCIGWPKSASDLKMLSKNSLINLLRKFQLRLHSWSITINMQTNFQIISQYRIFCETCPILVQNASLWNNAPTWLNNIFEPVRIKLHSGGSKRSLRKCQTLKRTAYTLEDEPRSGRPHTLSDDDRTELKEHMEEHPRMSTRRLPNSLITSAKQCGRHWKKKAFFPTEYQFARIKTWRLLSRLQLLLLVLQQIWP